MKVWKFYLKENKDSKYRLSAITNNKDFASIFIEQRNMDMYRVKTVKMDRVDFGKLVSCEDEIRKCLIDEYTVMTADVSSNGFIKHKEVSIICTDEEYTLLQNNIGDIESFEMNSALKWIQRPNPKIFNDKIQEALFDLGYTGLYKLCLSNENNDEIPLVSVDGLNAFIMLFHKRLNSK